MYFNFKNRSERVILSLIILSMFFYWSCGPNQKTRIYELQIREPITNLKIPHGVPVEYFPGKDANKVAPTDILKEISYFGAFAQVGLCSNSNNYPQPEIDTATSTGELMSKSCFVSCGWKFGQILTVSIDYPNGKTFSETFRARSSGMIVCFTPLLSDPAGSYEISISGQGVKLQHTILFALPSEPRAYLISDNRYLLYKFTPGESVRMLMYQCNGSTEYPDYPCIFRLWNEYVISDYGNLIVEFTETNRYYKIITSSGLEVKPDFLGIPEEIITSK